MREAFGYILLVTGTGSRAGIYYKSQTGGSPTRAETRAKNASEVSHIRTIRYWRLGERGVALVGPCPDASPCPSPGPAVVVVRSVIARRSAFSTSSAVTAKGQGSGRRPGQGEREGYGQRTFTGERGYLMGILLWVYY